MAFTMLLRTFKNKMLLRLGVFMICIAFGMLIITGNKVIFRISNPSTQLNHYTVTGQGNIGSRLLYNGKSKGTPYFLAPHVLQKLNSTLDKFKRTEIRNYGETLNVYKPYNERYRTNKSWEKFMNKIQRHRLYSEEDNVWEEVMWAMQTKRIADVEIKHLGTEFKFFMTLEDEMEVIVKPQRLSIDTDAPLDMNKNDFYERFQSEVAAFHLSRILGFHHVPPATSRYINITRDIKENPFAPSSLRESVHQSPDGRTCFVGTCEKKCGANHTICGNPALLAASIGMIIPETTGELNWVYSIGHIGRSDFCSYMERKSAIVNNAPRRFLDLIDVNIFDFIQGNPDRHHFNRLKKFGNDTNVILFDNGRGFSRALLDEIDFLLLMPKCCTIRHSTLKNLLAMANSREGLSGALQQSLESEIVQPLLNERHLLALDRRLLKILETIYLCIRNSDASYNGINIIDDGF